MTEISKMFENAGIKPLCQIPDKFCGVQNIYEDFTTEKQLKIIEWFISCRWWLNLKSLDKKIDFSLSFDEKLAKLVNRLWEILDETEKEEIRNILK